MVVFQNPIINIDKSMLNCTFMFNDRSVFQETNLNLRDVPHNIKDRFIRDYFSSKRSKVFLPIIYVIRDKDNSSPVDKEELPHNTSGALPQECDVKPPQPQSMGRRGSDSQLLSSTRRESDTTTAQPQSLTTISSKHKRHHDYETLQDLIMYVCFIRILY